MKKFKITLSASAKEALTFLTIFLSLYSFFIGGLALLNGGFDLGFAYVGLFGVCAMMTLGACSVMGDDSQSN